MGDGEEVDVATREAASGSVGFTGLTVTIWFVNATAWSVRGEYPASNQHQRFVKPGRLYQEVLSVSLRRRGWRERA